MKITEDYIISIRSAFENMQTKEDLLQLLNEVKPLIYGEKSVPFELKQLTWYANPTLGKSRYKEFQVKKKSGGFRTINAPINGLKAIQKVLGFILQCVFDPHKAAMGFVRGRSVADNARIHSGRNYVYNLDLKDFFPSIDQARIWKCLQLRPFNLSRDMTPPVNFIEWKSFKQKYLQTDGSVKFVVTKERMYTPTPLGILYTAKDFDKEKAKYVLLGSRSLKTKSGKPLEGTLWLTNYVPDVNRLEIANIIAALCCTEMEVERKNENDEWVKVNRNVLPQGAPTSPVISNIVCQRLDFLLTGVAKRFGLKYSRYADDITFSSMHNVFQSDSDFIKEFHRIIAEQGFHLNESKTRLQKCGYRQEVTGLLVNDKVNVQKRYVKQIRMWLYYWERYGYGKASVFFFKQYNAEKGQVKKGLPDMANVIGGKLDYLKMVKGGENDLYVKLKGRLNKLINTRTILRNVAGKLLEDGPSSNEVKITLVINQIPEKTEKLHNTIKILKDTKIPATFIVSNEPENDNNEGDIKTSKLFPHKPIYTVAFLKKFKIGDGSGFKEMVHDVDLSIETTRDILKKVKSHPNFVYHYFNEWISDVSYLNSSIQKETIKIIDLFENEGLPYYLKSDKHPFNNDNKYTNVVKQFKKKYRYGSGSEYSNLQADIKSICIDQHLPVSSLLFLPDERKFNIRSSFFTWQPSIYNGIRYIIQGVYDHSNINGIRPYNPTEKRILVEVERFQFENLSYVELRITDCNSVAIMDSNTLLYFYQGSSAFKYDFRNLCDWIVESDFIEETSKRLSLLRAPENSNSLHEIEEIAGRIGGYKHILRFYDI